MSILGTQYQYLTVVLVYPCKLLLTVFTHTHTCMFVSSPETACRAATSTGPGGWGGWLACSASSPSWWASSSSWSASRSQVRYRPVVNLQRGLKTLSNDVWVVLMCARTLTHAHRVEGIEQVFGHKETASALRLHGDI